MPTYTIEFITTDRHVIPIIAENESDALKKAKKEMEKRDVRDYYFVDAIDCKISIFSSRLTHTHTHTPTAQCQTCIDNIINK